MTAVLEVNDLVRFHNWHLSNSNIPVIDANSKSKGNLSAYETGGELYLIHTLLGINTWEDDNVSELSSYTNEWLMAHLPKENLGP